MPKHYASNALATATTYYRHWPTDRLERKRVRLVCRLLGLERILVERGKPALPPSMVESLRIWTTPTKEETG